MAETPESNPVARTSSPPHARLRLLKWAFPTVLLVLVAGTEAQEHFGTVSHKTIGPYLHFVEEVLVYGVGVAVALWLIMSWLDKTISLQSQTAARLRSTIRQARAAEEQVKLTNAELERRVLDRTRELEAARDTLAHKNEELTALERLKSEFVSLVSHELRSPLTNLNGGIELLLRREHELSQRSIGTLRTLGSQSQRLTRLVETILDISAMEAGKLVLNLRPLDVLTAITDQVEACEIGDARKKIRVTAEDSLPRVIADEHCFCNVLSTLLDNALKYAPDGRKIDVQAHRDNGTVRVTVADQGEGIPLADQERIFEMFDRLDTADHREIYGYGVGLYAARRLVEAMNGKIWVESAPGQGARFHFTLPVAPGGVALDG